jgi:hypothetical protein
VKSEDALVSVVEVIDASVAVRRVSADHAMSRKRLGSRARRSRSVEKGIGDPGEKAGGSRQRAAEEEGAHGKRQRAHGRRKRGEPLPGGVVNPAATGWRRRREAGRERRKTGGGKAAGGRQTGKGKRKRERDEKKR